MSSTSTKFEAFGRGSPSTKMARHSGASCNTQLLKDNHFTVSGNITETFGAKRVSRYPLNSFDMYLYLNSTDIYIYESDICILYTPLLFDLSRQLHGISEVQLSGSPTFPAKTWNTRSSADSLRQNSWCPPFLFQQILQVTPFWKNLST